MAPQEHRRCCVNTKHHRQSPPPTMLPRFILPKKRRFCSLQNEQIMKKPCKLTRSKDTMFSNVPAFPALDEILQGKKHPAPLPPPFPVPFFASLAVFTGSKAFQHIPVVVCVNKYKGKKKKTKQLWGAWTTASLPG